MPLESSFVVSSVLVVKVPDTDKMKMNEENQTIVIQNLKLIVLIVVIRLGRWKIRPKIKFFSSEIKA